MNGFTKFLASVLVLVLAVGAIAGFMALRFLTHAPSDSKETMVFEVKQGESFRSIAAHLQDVGLISSAWKLQIFGRISNAGSKIRVGEYALSESMNPKQILAVLASGHSIEYSVTVTEGMNRFEIADMLDKEKFAKKDEFLKLTSDPAVIRELLGQDLPTLEGYLFPDTYEITKYTGAKGLVKIMTQHFKENFAKLEATPGWSKGALTKNELVTLASIVEKETGAPEERPVIASVFFNRLRLKMPLQTDPTIIYGIWEATGTWNHNISKSDLQAPGKWNSYLNMGLPPGPISNPGFEALKAAGSPAQTDFLFFVSRNNGTHVFSKDYSQHVKAVEQFQLNRAAREGKSWRDLQNRDAVPAAVVDKVVKTPAKSVKPPTKSSAKAETKKKAANE